MLLRSLLMLQPQGKFASAQSMSDMIYIPRDQAATQAQTQLT